MKFDWSHRLHCTFADQLSINHIWVFCKGTTQLTKITFYSQDCRLGTCCFIQLPHNSVDVCELSFVKQEVREECSLAPSHNTWLLHYIMQILNFIKLKLAIQEYSLFPDNKFSSKHFLLITLLARMFLESKQAQWTGLQMWMKIHKLFCSTCCSSSTLNLDWI